MKQVYSFLKKLAHNNNREWFNSHKDEYLKAQATFNDFTQNLINKISLFDNEIDPAMLSVKDCTYRIYRDTRFSKDKTPYKTHMGAYIVRGGKKSPFAGYYFHLEPFSDVYSDGSMLACGLYIPDKEVLASVRDEISVQGDNFIAAVKRAKTFSLYTEYKMKIMPKGYEYVTNPLHLDLIKNRQFLVSKGVDEEYLFKDNNLAERVLADFKKCTEFIHILNRCVEFAYDENK